MDGAATLHKKIAKAFCAPGKIEGNDILAFIQHVILPYSQLQSPDSKTAAMNVVLKDQIEPTIFRSFAEVTEAYAADDLTPQVARQVVAGSLIKLTTSICHHFETIKNGSVLPMLHIAALRYHLEGKTHRRKGMRRRR